MQFLPIDVDQIANLNHNDNLVRIPSRVRRPSHITPKRDDSFSSLIWQVLP